MSDDARTEGDTVEQRDREWLANVYRGDKEKDLTVRAIVAGMMFGGLMSLSNLYVGLKTGWGLGVDIAAVVVIFSVFKALRGIGLVRSEFGIMENTMMMSVAVAASWISSAGLVSSVPALQMLRPDYDFVWWQLTLFIGVILYLGLFMCIPLKRQMIQVEQLRFPGNIPTGETLKVLYAQGGEAIKKATALFSAAGMGMLVGFLRDGLGWLPDEPKLPLQFMGVPLALRGVSLNKLTLTLQPSLIFVSIGALFGMKVGMTMLVGVVVNYGILAPYMIDAKDINHSPPKIAGVAAPRFPLSMKKGQSFAVKLEVAKGRPMLPSPEELKSNPDLAATVNTSTVSYTWTQPKVYKNIDSLIDDVNALSLLDGSPNPFHESIRFGKETDKSLGKEADKSLGKETDESLGKEVVVLDAPSAIDWESKLSFPADQKADTIEALGLQVAADAGQADREKAKAKQKGAMQAVGGFRNINRWSVWPGATVLVVAGLLALAFQWRSLGRTFASIFAGLSGDQGAVGPVDHIEIPMSWFVVGFPLAGLLATLLLIWVFQIQWWMGVVAVVVSFFLAAVVARAGAETSINPIGAMGKVTQLTFGVLAKGNVTANLMTAGVTAGAACSCSDTVGNLKVGHMVGANPRKQFISQFFGVFAGAILAVPAYFILVPDANALGSDKFPAPSALVWKAVAEMLSKGLDAIPQSAQWAVAVAFVLGTIIVVIDNLFPKVKPYTPSPTALGIALTMPGSQGLAMFLGALIAWILEKRCTKWHEMYTIPVASGCIAGESIMGVVIAVLIALGIM
jgi:uncharacterized oligopeptide transporter (OPT) family protein